MKELQVKPTLDALEQVTAFVEQELTASGVPFADIMQMNIAVDEVFANIIHYSGASDAVISCQVEHGAVTLCFADNGTPYDPTLADDPDVTLSAEARDIGGLGIFMVKQMMTCVTYAHQDGKNILRLVKEMSE